MRTMGWKANLKRFPSMARRSAPAREQAFSTNPVNPFEKPAASVASWPPRAKASRAKRRARVLCTGVSPSAWSGTFRIVPSSPTPRIASSSCAPMASGSEPAAASRTTPKRPSASSPPTPPVPRLAASARPTRAATPPPPDGAASPAGAATSISDSTSPVPAARRSAASPPLPAADAFARKACFGRADTVMQKWPASPPAAGNRSPATETGVPAAFDSRNEVGGSRSQASRVLKAPSKAGRSASENRRSTGRPSQSSGGSPKRRLKAPTANSIRPSGDASSSMSAAVRAKVMKRSRPAGARPRALSRKRSAPSVIAGPPYPLSLCGEARPVV